MADRPPADPPPGLDYTPPQLAETRGAAPAWAGALPDALPANLGRYRLLKELGRGGMGAVYLAHDTQLDRRVALKIPLFAAGSGDSARQRFLREARAAATLCHPNLCPVYDVGQIDNVYFLTMAFIEGKSLSALLRGGKAITPRAAVIMIRQLALAMAEAHERGVVHRDLKPANIMVTPKRQPVVMDFGLARRVETEDVRLTRDGMIMGTPAYMSPEQAGNDHDAVGPASDQYSLGVIFYELLTGRLPFQASDPMSLMIKRAMQPPDPPTVYRADLDPRLTEICLRVLARKPEDRYPDMATFAAALGHYLHDSAISVESLRDAGPFSRITENISAIDPPPPLPPLPWRKGPLVAGAAVVGLLAVAGTVAAVKWLAWHTPPAPPPPPLVTPPDPQVPPVVRPPPLVKPRPTSPPRLPEPDKAAVAATEKSVRDLLKADYASRDPKVQLALSGKLLQEAVEARDDPTARYVLLREARDAAIRAGYANEALDAIARLDREFAVDGVALCLAALEAVRPKLPDLTSGTAEARQLHADWAEAAVIVADEAARSENYAAARDLLQQAVAAARTLKNGSLVKRARDKTAEVQELQKEYDEQKALAARLQADPDDPKANLTRGQFLCLRQGRWDQGLPLVVKGPDLLWRSAARLDLAGPTDPEACRAVGDAWWQAAKEERGRARALVRRRASDWYDKALPGLSGLPQLQLVEKIKPYRGAPDLAKLKPVLDLDWKDPLKPPAKGKNATLEWGHANGCFFLKSFQPGEWLLPPLTRNNPSAFACQVVGRVVQPNPSAWRVLFEDENGNSVVLEVDSTGASRVITDVDRGKTTEARKTVSTARHVLTRPHGQFNSLLAVVRGRQLEVYINELLVHGPLALDRPLGPCSVTLAPSTAAKDGALVEFERFTVWHGIVPSGEDRLVAEK